MQKQFLWAVVVVIVLGGAYWWWQSGQAPAADTESNVPASEDQNANTGTDTGTNVNVGVEVGTSSGAPLSATVSYDGSSLSPTTVTIRKGGMVTWSNNGDASMWIASAQHPTHMVYAGTSMEEHCPDTSNASFDQCKGGDSFSFIFNKTGTWRYHNHLQSSVFGSVVVVE